MDIPISAIKCPYCHEKQYLGDDDNLPETSEKIFLWAKIVGVISALAFVISFFLPGDWGEYSAIVVASCPVLITFTLVFAGYRVDYKKAKDGDSRDEALYNSKSIGAKMTIAGVVISIFGLWGAIVGNEYLLFNFLAILGVGVWAMTFGLVLYLLDKLDD